MFYKVRKIILTVIVISTVLLVQACSDAKSSIKVADTIIAIPVIAEPASVGSINAAYGTTASLEAAQEADASARVSGIVTNVLVEEGDFVEAGQALAQLEVEKLALEVKREIANLNQVANDLRRNKKLYSKNLISSESFEHVKFQYDAQKAATELAELNLEYATIRAPISGVVAVRYIKLGNLLKQNAPAFHITDLSEIHAIIHIPESEKAELAVGQKANVLVEAAKHPFLGSIKRISPVVDRDTGTIRVTVSLNDETEVLRPGMFSRVSIIYDTHAKAILVPKDSILSQDDEVSVFVIKDGIAYKKLVNVGFSNTQFIEIVSGVEINDLVITTGQRSLKDKSNIELIETVAVL